MKIKALIEALQKLDPEREIFILEEYDEWLGEPCAIGNMADVVDPCDDDGFYTEYEVSANDKVIRCTWDINT